MKQKMYILILVIVTGILLTSNCGLLKKSPSETVKAAYMAANKGDYSEAERYLSSEAINTMKGIGALGGGTKGIWDRNTRNGTIEKIEILNEDIRGEGATVLIKIHFKDGSTTDSTEPLIQENGSWKLTVG